MRVAVAGSRGYPYLVDVAIWVEQHMDPEEDVLISGGARGPDRVAEEVFTNMGGEVRIHYPQWNEYGKSAGMLRNEKVIREAERLVAFWDGESRGTYHAIELARAKGIPVDVIEPMEIRDD